MNILRIPFRSLLQKGRHNLIKITSLSVGLALGLVLLAKVYFEQSYNDFYLSSSQQFVSVVMMPQTKIPLKA